MFIANDIINAKHLLELIDGVESNTPALNKLFRSPILFSFEVLSDIVDKNVGWNISKELLEGRLLILAVSELLDCSRSSKALFERDLKDANTSVQI